MSALLIFLLAIFESSVLKRITIGTIATNNQRIEENSGIVGVGNGLVVGLGIDVWLDVAVGVKVGIVAVCEGVAVGEGVGVGVGLGVERVILK